MPSGVPVRVRLRALNNMAVNLSAPTFLPAINGIRLGCARAVKSKTRNDLTAIDIAADASVAGVFTQNLFPAPPVQICRQHLQNGGGGNIRGLVINSGIANAGTLGRGLQDAKKSCQLFAALMGYQPRDILPFSTGVIMEYLPMDNYAAGLQRCTKSLAADNWLAAAAAIMTTDTVCKGAFRRVVDKGRAYTVTGIAKGSGMIHPNMATMLAFVATDAAVPPPLLASWQRQIVGETFNAISVDGDTSTNDSFLLIATGRAGKCRYAPLKQAVLEVCAELAEAIVRDGEGASKLAIIDVRGASSRAICRRVAVAVARSPLVKTALAAADANVGRFLMAVGNGGGGFRPQDLQMQIGDVPIIQNGGLHPQYNEQKTAAVLSKDTVQINICLGAAKTAATIKTCDLTHDYININAAYRS